MSQINLNLNGKCPKASASPSAAPSDRGWNGYMTKQQSLVMYPFHLRLLGAAEGNADAVEYFPFQFKLIYVIKCYL